MAIIYLIEKEFSLFKILCVMAKRKSNVKRIFIYSDIKNGTSWCNYLLWNQHVDNIMCWLLFFKVEKFKQHNKRQRLRSTVHICFLLFIFLIYAPLIFSSSYLLIRNVNLPISTISLVLSLEGKIISF